METETATMSRPFNIYEITDDEEVHHIGARSIREALDVYFPLFASDEEDAADWFEFLSVEKCPRKKVLTFTDDSDIKQAKTCEELAANAEKPELICTTTQP